MVLYLFLSGVFSGGQGAQAQNRAGAKHLPCCPDRHTYKIEACFAGERQTACKPGSVSSPLKSFGGKVIAIHLYKAVTSLL